MSETLDIQLFDQDTSATNRLIMMLGIGLTLAANVLHLAASYLIKIKEDMSPTDHLLSRAFTQTLAFGLWSLLGAICAKSRKYNGK